MNAELNLQGGDAVRLTPVMASRRLQVLEFVRSYLVKYGASPSYGEIARGCGTNTSRVKEALQSLVKSGLLLRRPGPRGLALPDTRDAAIQLLSELGYMVFDERTVIKPALQSRPLLDYDPVHGREIIGQEGSQDGSAKAA